LRNRLARERAMALGAVAIAIVFARGCFVEIADPAEPGDTDGGGTTGSGGSTGTGGSVANGGTSGTTGASGGDANDGDTNDAPDVSCAIDEKNCNGTCEKIDDPEFGCASTGCTPCFAGKNLVTSCSGDSCQQTGCKTGFFDCDGDIAGTGCEVGFGSGVGPDADAAADPVIIPQLVPPITVDGDLADWSEVLVRPLESACTTCSSTQPGGQPPPQDGQGNDGGVIVFSGDVPPPSDLTAHFAMAWSNSGLDIAVLTLDDELVPPSPDAGLSSLQQDGLELFIDVAPFPPLNPDYENGKDRHVFLGSGDLNTWEPNIASTVSEDDIARASSRNERCQIVELRIRWNPYLGTTPVSGTEYGFTIAVNDWDTSRQGTRREHQVFWRVPSAEYAFRTLGFARVQLE
jgi:hypothetical protein